MANRRLKGDQAAMGTSVVAFLVAGVLFVASVVAVLVTTRESASRDTVGDDLDAAQLQVQARGLANLLLDSPGFLSSGAEFGPDGVVGYDGKLVDADAVSRLGLLDPNSAQPFMMDFAKFQNLRQAPAAADPTDDYINYEEARIGLGLAGGNLDFHLRSYPKLSSYAELMAEGRKDTILDVAYISAATSVNEETVDEVVVPDGYLLELRHPDGVASSAAAVAAGGHCVVDTAAPSGYTFGIEDLACANSAGNPIKCTATTKGFHLATYVYNAGTTTTQFEAIWDVDFTNGQSAYHKLNTFEVNPGATAELFTDLAALSGRTCTGLAVNLKVYDTEHLLAELQKTLTSSPTISGTLPTKALMVDVGSEYYEDDDAITIKYDGTNMATGDKLILTICPGTTECRISGDTTGYLYWENSVPSNENNRKFTINKNDFTTTAVDALGRPVGEYTVRLYYNFGSNTAAIDTTQFRSLDRLLILGNHNPDYEIDEYGPPEVVVTPPVAGEYLSNSATAVEVGYIEGLMGKFCPYWYDSDDHSPMSSDVPPAGDIAYAGRCALRNVDATHPHVGDVYPSNKKTLKNVLEARLLDPVTGLGSTQWTDLLVIGSDVDHNKLTSQDVKGTIEAWVFAGGTLIVFGSADMQTHWLESIFHTAQELGEHGNGVSVPDEGHPVLNVPNDLAWDAYDHDYAWRLKVTGSFDAEDAFTRVVNELGGTPTNPSNAVLAVSDPGDFQAGSVILTGWLPWDLETDGTASSTLAEEGMMLVHNLLMLGYRDLYLDYGPSLPMLTSVIPAVRQVDICHPEFDDESTPLCDEPIPMDMNVYVFGWTGS